MSPQPERCECGRLVYLRRWNEWLCIGCDKSPTLCTCDEIPSSVLSAYERGSESEYG